VDRQRGSHVMLKKDGSNVVLSIPQHRQLGKGLLRSLIADSGLSVAEFVKFL
jgi:predicted RNA binding protein YcfA (HicA-like mRNA interferase family)